MRDVNANFLRQVCHNVVVEPELPPTESAKFQSGQGNLNNINIRIMTSLNHHKSVNIVHTAYLHYSIHASLVEALTGKKATFLHGL